MVDVSNLFLDEQLKELVPNLQILDPEHKMESIVAKLICAVHEMLLELGSVVFALNQILLVYVTSFSDLIFLRSLHKGFNDFKLLAHYSRHHWSLLVQGANEG